MQHTGPQPDVYAYDTSFKPIDNVPIVSGAMDYDDPVSGDTFILVFHESLYYGTTLDHSLINWNQVCAYGIPFGTTNPYDPDHKQSIDVNDSLQISLQPVGTKLQLYTWVPSSQESQNCEHFQMTSLHTWNPKEIVMVQALTQAGSMLWKRHLLSIGALQYYKYLDADSDKALLDSIDPSLVHIGKQISEHCQSWLDFRSWHCIWTASFTIPKDFSLHRMTR